MQWIRATAVILLLAAQGALAEEARTITVTATGRIDAVPDMATVTLGVTTQARLADEALAANSRDMAQVLDTLAGAGIAARDLQTSGLSLSPRWDSARSTGGAPRIVGFVASNRVTARVRDLETLGGVLDAVAGDGANTFEGVQFGLQEPGPVEDAARAAAVAEARRLAQLYAEAAGVALGELLSLSEAGGAPQPQPMFRAEMAMASDAVPVAPGELSLTARVTLVYGIAD